MLLLPAYGASKLLKQLSIILIDAQMTQELTMIARHSPRVRTMQTADHFMEGFREVAEKHGIKLSFVSSPKWTVAEEGKEKRKVEKKGLKT